MKRTRSLLLAAAAVIALCGMPRSAEAQNLIKIPGDHPAYKVELEPHLAFGWARHYGDEGIGVGLSGSVVIVDNGFVPTINNSVAITFGLDWLRYDACYWYGPRYYYGCGASFFLIPVAMQWNFWFSPKFSAFGEPGLYIYHGVWDDYCPPGLPCVDAPSRTGFRPAFWAGGRYHFNDTIALALRLGYPTLTFGVSFLL
jgi:hypothetical protein